MRFSTWLLVSKTVSGFKNNATGVATYRYHAWQLAMFGATNNGGNFTGIERDWNSTQFLADASFFTIKNITLGYNIGASQQVLQIGPCVRFHSAGIHLHEIHRVDLTRKPAHRAMGTATVGT
jgi:hypothetical protein